MNPIPYRLFCAFVHAAVVIPAAHGADELKSKTTYAEAYGKTKNAVAVDAAKELPHYPAVEPRDAVATWRVKPGFKIQLAAHEPQVRDPIAICFDERGRMFVCEMIDYSEMRDAKPHLGRISMLEDRDGDGYYETSKVFADDLPWPTGLVWANGGLYVGATPDIWRLEDRDGDGRAEVREKVFTGFGTGLKILNVQGLLNSFQWGQDNRVHVLAGGGNRGVITCLKRPELPGLELGGKDFWFDPLTHEFGLENGGAQYGMSFDNFGRKFGCSNSDHLQHWVYEGDPAARHPFTTLPASRQSIAVDGGAAEVFRLSPDEPWRIVRTRWRIAGAVPGAVEGGGRVSGYFTGATGTTIYRGDAYGADFVNNSFSGDAGGQLVHRKIIHPAADGVNLAGERPADERGFEFAASTDTWVRVVNFANAPDGCLHVCDMYREIIEHPWAIPDEIKKHLDLNNGNDRGRIYRLVPEAGAGRIGQKAALHEAGTGELVKLLGHPNGWHRDTAQRLLYERQDKEALPMLRELITSTSTLAKLHALGALAGQKALDDAALSTALGDADASVRERALVLATTLTPGPQLIAKIASLVADPSPRVRFQLALTLGVLMAKVRSPDWERALVSLARQDHAHPWISPAVLTAPPAVLSSTLFTAFTQEAPLALQAAPFIARLIEIRAASSPATDHAALIDFITKETPNPLWLRALGTGLRRAGSTINKADTGSKLAAAFQQAASTAADTARTTDARLAAIELLSFAPLQQSQPALTACLSTGQPDALQTAALQALAQHASMGITQLLLEHWPHYAEKAREAALLALLARDDRQTALLGAIQAGTIPATALSAAQVQSLARHKDANIATQAKAALASVIPPSRAEVLNKFRAAVNTKGDATRGQTHYLQRCLACHRAAGQGLQVGPDLITVKTKGRDALLTAILDPTKEVAAQYILYTVTTKDGGTYTGFISEDNATSVTLKMAGGAEQKIERSTIRGTTSSGQSLMPEGLETGLTVQDMADLLSFIEELK